MISLTLSAAAGAMNGALSGTDAALTGVSTDTRSLHPGELFFALRGPRFDGHNMAAEALAGGAAGVVVDRSSVALEPRISVADTRAALGHLARHWRRRFNVSLLGVTGSVGKTTVKEMLGSILQQCGPTLATRGNLNNDIGVPMTLFRLDATHRYAVIEMGANRAGDIATLAAIAEPEIGVITLCAPSHLEGFGDIDTVARTKGELAAGLTPDGTAILNQTDPYLPLWRDLAGERKVITFGAGGDVYADNIRVGAEAARFDLHSPNGDIAIELAYKGAHNVNNALAAAAAALAAGADLVAVRDGLAVARPASGRLQILSAGEGVQVIDDSYNANPASFAAALEALSHEPGEHWVVFGDMGELGADAIEHHAAAGRGAREAGVVRLFTVGDLSTHAASAFGPGGEHYGDHAALVSAVRDALDRSSATVTLLVKGSRFMALEQVVQALTRAEASPC